MADGGKFNIVCPAGFIPELTEQQLFEYFGQLAAQGAPLTIQVPYYGLLSFSSPDYQVQPELRRLLA